MNFKCITKIYGHSCNIPIFLPCWFLDSCAKSTICKAISLFCFQDITASRCAQYCPKSHAVFLQCISCVPAQINYKICKPGSSRQYVLTSFSDFVAFYLFSFYHNDCNKLFFLKHLFYRVVHLCKDPVSYPQSLFPNEEELVTRQTIITWPPWWRGTKIFWS
jgi:hypothetical protein